MTSSWLPVQLTAVQPYTMCHSLRLVDPDVDCATLATPTMGTIQMMDRPEVQILACLIAPRNVQRAAQAQGIEAVMMVRPKGIELIAAGVHRG